MRETFLVHLYEMLNSIASRLPTNIRGPDRKKKAMSLFALLLGSIQLSRASRGTALSEPVIGAAIKGANTLLMGDRVRQRLKARTKPAKKALTASWSIAITLPGSGPAVSFPSELSAEFSERTDFQLVSQW